MCVCGSPHPEKGITPLGPPNQRMGCLSPLLTFPFLSVACSQGGEEERERNGLEARIEGETERSSAQKDGCNLGGLLPFPPKNRSGNLNAFSWPGRKYLITFFPAAI